MPRSCRVCLGQNTKSSQPIAPAHSQDRGAAVNHFPPALMGPASSIGRFQSLTKMYRPPSLLFIDVVRWIAEILHRTGTSGRLARARWSSRAGTLRAWQRCLRYDRPGGPPPSRVRCQSSLRSTAQAQTSQAAKRIRSSLVCDEERNGSSTCIRLEYHPDFRAYRHDRRIGIYHIGQHDRPLV